MDLQVFLSNPVALAGAVASTVAWLKARFNLTGNRTVLVSFLVSVSFIGAAVLSQYYPEVINYIVLAILGAVGSGGSIDILKGVLPRVQEEIRGSI